MMRWRAAAAPFVARIKSRRVLSFTGAVFVAAALASLATRNISLLSYMERFAGDLRTAVLLPHEPQNSAIVIVAITEETLARFPYRSPIDRAFVSGLLRLLERRGVRAIGVDILFDQPTEPAKDQLLRETLDGLAVPAVVGYSEDPEVVNDAQRRFLAAFIPERQRGLSNLATDPVDNTVRWIYPGHRQDDGEFVPGLVYAVASKAGVNVRPEQVEIAWRGRPVGGAEPFKTYPAHLVDQLPPAWFKDKIVLIGAELSITDRHRTPFAAIFEGNRGVLPGVVITAHGLAQLLDGRVARVPGWRAGFAMALLAASVGALLGLADVNPAGRIGAATAVVIALWLGGFALFHFTRLQVTLVETTLSFALAVWAMDSVGGREARRQREFIKSAFSRYVSPKVVDLLVRNPSALSLRGERRTMTLLFTDVAGFTSMAEAVGSERLSPLMNAYFDGVCNVLLRHDGTVDKFIGDSVFAIFNAPAEQADHAARAIQCALEIDRFAEAFRAEQFGHGVDFGVTRIGVHTGRAMVGNFGSTARMEYTATAFSSPFKRVFDFFYRPTKRLEIEFHPESRLFVERIEYENPTRSIFEDWLYRPVLGTLSAVARRARAIQSGSTNVYLAYILVMLLVLLVLA
jgi:class 3 adenylate cyclase